MTTQSMRVILGVCSLKAYVAAPRAFHVLGIVRFGMEYGLLATNAEGTYFRVNGSQTVPLDSAVVHRAIDSSYGPRAPKVSIRKHRHVAAPAQQPRHSQPMAMAMAMA